jgi:hypothetical protein
MRITKYWPRHNWNTIWANLHMAPISDNMKGEVYKIINDLTPTNIRLQKINLASTDKCKRCTIQDTLIHRIMECEQGMETWNWASSKMAQMLRIDAKHIPKEWVLRPHYKLWPPQKHAAI